MARTPLVHIIILTAFLVNSFGAGPLVYAESAQQAMLPLAQAQTVSVALGDLRLPAPGVRVSLSPQYNPPILKGIKVHPDDPFRFDFILDKGDSLKGTVPLSSRGQSPFIEATKLIKYFLASLTTPEKDLWVNLSPYEKDRIVPDAFGRTEMGRDLLAEDYMLKQITASLIYPEDEIGKKFWKRIYEEAAKKFGTTNIPVNTFNKVWIVPQKAVVYENIKTGTAYVVESKLKVMLEQDYLSMSKHADVGEPRRQDPDTNRLGSQIIREIVIPQLTKEVNENKNFAQLRQVYNSLILATWYKKKIKDSIFSQVYSDKNKVAGVDIDDPQEKDKIYQRYLQAFKKGAYNYIKEDMDPLTQQPVPRRYFSGGADFAQTSLVLDDAMVTTSKIDFSQLSRLSRLTVFFKSETDRRAKFNDSLWDERKMDEAADSFSRQAGIPAPKTENYFKINDKQYAFGFGDSFQMRNGELVSSRIYRLGPFLFPVLSDLGGIPESHQPGTISYFKHEMEKKLDRDFYLKNKKNIIFIPIHSAVYRVPFNNYTAAMGAVMLANASKFKDAVVYDLGAGSGILSLMALSLGARKVVLIDNDAHETSMARDSLLAHDYIENEDFYIIREDLTRPGKVLKALSRLQVSSNKVIGLLNMGSWYGKVNRLSLEILTRLQVGLLINGGYYTEDTLEHGKHRTEFDASAQRLKSEGFNTQELNFLGTNVLVADRASLAGQVGSGDQAMTIEDQEREMISSLLGHKLDNDLSVLVTYIKLLIDGQAKNILQQIQWSQKIQGRLQKLIEFLKNFDPGHPGIFFRTTYNGGSFLATPDTPGYEDKYQAALKDPENILSAQEIEALSRVSDFKDIYGALYPLVNKMQTNVDRLLAESHGSTMLIDAARFQETLALVDRLVSSLDAVRGRLMSHEGNSDSSIGLEKEGQKDRERIMDNSILDSFQDLRKLSVDTGRDDTIFSYSNEANYENVLKGIRVTGQVVRRGTLHIGVSGMQNLDIMAARHSEWGILMDINRRNGDLFGLIENIFKDNPLITREEFMGKLRNRVDQIEPDDREDAHYFFKTGRIREMFFLFLRKEGSWLYDDVRYEHIKSMFLNNRIIFIQNNVDNYSVFKQVLAWMQQTKVALDTFYASNVLNWSYFINTSGFYSNIASVSNKETVILDSANKQVILTIKGKKDFLQATEGPAQLDDVNLAMTTEEDQFKKMPRRTFVATTLFAGLGLLGSGAYWGNRWASRSFMLRSMRDQYGSIAGMDEYLEFMDRSLTRDEDYYSLADHVGALLREHAPFEVFSIIPEQNWRDINSSELIRQNFMDRIIYKGVDIYTIESLARSNAPAVLRGIASSILRDMSEADISVLKDTFNKIEAAIQTKEAPFKLKQELAALVLKSPGIRAGFEQAKYNLWPQHPYAFKLFILYVARYTYAYTLEDIDLSNDQQIQKKFMRDVLNQTRLTAKPNDIWDGRMEADGSITINDPNSIEIIVSTVAHEFIHRINKLPETRLFFGTRHNEDITWLLAPSLGFFYKSLMTNKLFEHAAVWIPEQTNTRDWHRQNTPHETHLVIRNIPLSLLDNWQVVVQYIKEHKFFNSDYSEPGENFHSSIVEGDRLNGYATHYYGQAGGFLLRLYALRYNQMNFAEMELAAAVLRDFFKEQKMSGSARNIEDRIIALVKRQRISYDIGYKEMESKVKPLVEELIHARDIAQVSIPGGIDLTPADMNLQTRNTGEGIKFHLDPAMLQQLQNTSGFVPVIIDIQPLDDLKSFLEL